MNFVVIGVNHQTAPVEVREHLPFLRRGCRKR